MDIASIERDLATCETEINSLISIIDAAMAEVKSSKEAFQSSSSRNIGIPTSNPNFIQINYSGSTFNIIKTPNISVLELVEFVRKNKIYQAAHIGYNNYENKCLGVAKAYGRALMIGKIPQNIDSFYGGAYTYYEQKGKFSTNKNNILNYVYNELSSGRPCVIEVTTQKGGRHFATVVGMKNHVNKASDLKEEDLLIIDAWDGKLEAMDNSETADRHLYVDWRGNYRVDLLLQSKIGTKG